MFTHKYCMVNKNRVVVLTGAGMSAESGISTFRDAGGLWEGYDVMEVASPEGWRRNPELVLDFYNQRRRQLKTVYPNAGHVALKKLEDGFDVHIVTQNVDDLHERAGSSSVLHLHGELKKVRSDINDNYVIDWTEDVTLDHQCPQGGRLRPHIVWFGEMVPMLDTAALKCSEADIVMIIGTSLQVYPAAGLISYAPAHAQVYYIDPYPSVSTELNRIKKLHIIKENAARGVPALVDELLSVF